MTREEILAMPAGKELDDLVTEKVMGWKERVDFDYVDGIIARYIPDTMDVVNFQPSTDISAAWEVVEKIKGMGIRARISFAKHLKEMFKASGTHEIAAWPEAIFLLEPKHLCISALIAVMEGQAHDHN